MKTRPCLFLVAISLYACNKNADNPNPDTNNTNDTITHVANTDTAQPRLLLTGAVGTDNFSPSLSYKYNNDRTIASMAAGLGNYYFYYQNRQLHHILSFSSDNSLLTMYSTIFMYDTGKRCVRVIQKSLSSYNPSVLTNDNPFFSDTTRGSYNQYDSLSYSATGQLIEIRDILDKSVTRITSFLYNKPEDAAPYKVNVYYTNTGTPTLAIDVRLSTSTMDQPAFENFWFTPFLGFQAPLTPDLILNGNYLACIKKCITSSTVTFYHSGTSDSQSQDAATYYFSKDSTYFYGQYVNDNMGRHRIQYHFNKQ